MATPPARNVMLLPLCKKKSGREWLLLIYTLPLSISSTLFLFLALLLFLPTFSFVARIHYLFFFFVFWVHCFWLRHVCARCTLHATTWLMLHISIRGISELIWRHLHALCSAHCFYFFIVLIDFKGLRTQQCSQAVWVLHSLTQLKQVK